MSRGKHRKSEIKRAVESWITTVLQQDHREGQGRGPEKADGNGRTSKSP